jgi:hypothetical protein
MDAAGNSAAEGSSAARLFCSLCFASDHERSICRLVVPAAIEAAGGAAGSDSEEEEDPEELGFEEDAVGGGSEGDAPADGDDGFIPIADGDAFLPAPGDEELVPDGEDLEEPERPDYVDVFMPFVNLRHFDDLSFAFINPPTPQPYNLILQAADLGCGPDRVDLFPSSRGARLAVFSTPQDRENAMNNGPYFGREVSVFFERHDESDNRFLFEHESMAALSIEDYPMEHWQRHHIIHSSRPYANPHSIDPICLTGVDFSAVLITVKAESITDVPDAW